jgi:hypothetical protein
VRAWLGIQPAVQALEGPTGFFLDYFYRLLFLY